MGEVVKMRAFLHKQITDTTVKTVQVELEPTKDYVWPRLLIWDHQLWVFQEDVVDHAHYFQANAVTPLREIK